MVIAAIAFLVILHQSVWCVVCAIALQLNRCWLPLNPFSNWDNFSGCDILSNWNTFSNTERVSWIFDSLFWVSPWEWLTINYHLIFQPQDFELKLESNDKGLRNYWLKIAPDCKAPFSKLLLPLFVILKCHWSTAVEVKETENLRLVHNSLAWWWITACDAL